MKTTIRLDKITINRLRLHKVHPRATDDETLNNLLNIFELLEGKDSSKNPPPSGIMPSNNMLRERPLHPDLAELAIRFNQQKKVMKK